MNNLQNLEKIQFLVKNDILKNHRIQSEKWLMCCCPFHQEKKPSFGINMETGQYNCFSCGEGGFDFDSFFKKISKAYNINFENKKVSKSTLLNMQIQNINLKKKENVLNNKYISEDILLRFKDECGDWILNRINNKNVLKTFEVGYSKIKNQYIIPIRDLNKKLLGYAIRQFKEPKYLYNKGLKKRTILFGLDKCKGQTGIITEGPLDVIKSFDNDCKNCVGLLGAKMTNEQESTILKYYNKIYIATDNDEAGMRCSEDICQRLKDKIKVYKFIWKTNKKDLGELSKEELKYEIDHSKICDYARRF
jgi:DNA primase